MQKTVTCDGSSISQLSQVGVIQICGHGTLTLLDFVHSISLHVHMFVQLCVQGTSLTWCKICAVDPMEEVLT